MNILRLLRERPRRFLLLSLVIVVVLFAVLWVSNHSFLSVNVATNDAGGVVVEVLDQKSGKTTTKKASGQGTVRLLTTRGSKEVVVRQGDKSDFSVKQLGGFLGTTPVEASPSPEKQRRFVGNNPESCLEYAGILYSYPCGGYIESLSAHLAASSDESTSTVSPEDIAPGVIIGTLPLGDHVLVVTRSADEGDEISYTYTARTFDRLGNITNAQVIRDLDKSLSYELKPYKDGMLFVPEDVGQMLYVGSDLSTTEDLEMDAPNNKDLRLVSINTSKENIVAIYTKASPEDTHESKSVKTATEIVLYESGKSRHINLGEYYTTVTQCTSKTLCAVFNKTLTVLDVSGDKAKKLYQVDRVDEVLDTGDTTLIARGNDLLALNIDNRQGSFIYSYGDYVPCATKRVKTGYVLCLIDKRQDRVALYVDSTQSNTDSIDKRISQLLDAPEIKAVSIYDRFIHVSPELGEREYIRALGGYGYSPQKTQAAALAINAKVTSVGIDTSVYSVINTRP